MPDVKTLYDEDFVLWSEQQADALRAAARGSSNQPIDWENVAEEIEALGRSERRELASRLSLIIEHLAKLTHSLASYPLRRWRETIRRERAEVERLLEDSPILKREVPDLIGKETPRTVERVVADLVERGEIRRSLRQSLKAKTYLDLCRYSEEQVLGDWFPPEPSRPASGE